MGKSKIIYNDKTLIDLTSDTVTADTLRKGVTAHGKDGEPITGIFEGIIPTGNINITDNGEYDVTEFAKAVVNVAGGTNPDGSMVLSKMAQGSITGSGQEITDVIVPLNFTPKFFYIYASQMFQETMGSACITSSFNADLSSNKINITNVYSVLESGNAYSWNIPYVGFLFENNSVIGAYLIDGISDIKLLSGIEYKWFAMG